MVKLPITTTPPRLAAAWLIAAMFLPATLVAQEDQPTQQHFSIRKAGDKFVNALEDFERYRDKQAWDKAFHAIESAGAVDATAMVARKDGFMFPARRRVQDLLCSMPPEGRDAYRLFNDANAKKLYEQAIAPADGKPEDLAALRKVVDQYFITSIGDQAADRLADALFESGDFVGADILWAMVLEKYPDSDLPALRLQVKRGIAMARNKRWDALAALIARLRESSNNGATLSIGGQDVAAADFLQSLMTVPSSAPTTSPIASGAALALPQSDNPSWQCKFADDDLADKMGRALAGMGWNAAMIGPLATTVPASACDAQRVYVNWLGIGFAIDAKTGKLLWRTDKFTDIGDKVNMLVESSVDAGRYATVMISKDLVCFVRIPIKNITYQSPFRLTAHEVATGKQKWSTETGPLTAFNFCGDPIVADGLILAAASKTGGTDMLLLAIHPEDGKLEYQISLGQATTGQNYRGQATSPSAQVMAHEGMVYVMTNNGALLAISTSARRLEWAFTCDGPPIMGQQRFFSPDMVMPTAGHTGAILAREGVLYMKETGADAVYAIDLSGPTLKWRRPLDRSDSIAGISNNQMITIGDDVCGIELDHRAMVWSARLPTGCSPQVDASISGKDAFVFAGRGVFQIDTTSGNVASVFRGHDRDSLGGVVYTAGGKMITVSNQAVTAYPLGASASRTQ